MLSTHLMERLAAFHIEEQVEARRYDRVIRHQHVKRIAQRNLSRGIEHLLKVGGNAQTVLDILERFKTEETIPRTSCSV